MARFSLHDNLIHIHGTSVGKGVSSISLRKMLKLSLAAFALIGWVTAQSNTSSVSPQLLI